jgi:peptide-methionine (S)-S-oxide reductase
MNRLKHTSRLLQAISGAVLAVALISAQAKVQEADTMDSSEKSYKAEDTAKVATEPRRYEKATFAAGCFWGVEAAFRQVKGVISTTVGYTGGRTKNPTYRRVCSGRTGHAEAVQLTYDPNQVSYEQLLDVFWRIHDPTTLNRQGLPQPETTAHGQGLKSKTRALRQIQQAHRDRDYARIEILPGRRIPPAIP